MKKDEYSQDEIFTYDKLKKILDETIGKTLGEVDKNHVFDRTKGNPKITGIAGDVIEQSVLGYSANNDNHPDILVDGKKVEVKTTGIRFSKKKVTPNYTRPKSLCQSRRFRQSKLSKKSFILRIFGISSYIC